ncbi:uncharacterized protein [Littorina saxatilis]|uniref:uncharacterized protein n=1 Tax=Littorina saxatilis TaxID=31220 RepID=UPI0038B4562B
MSRSQQVLEDKLRRAFSKTTNDTIEELVRIGINILIPTRCNPLPAEVEAAHRFLRMCLLHKQNRRKWDVAVPMHPPTNKTGMTQEQLLKEEQIHEFVKCATTTLEGAPPAAAAAKAPRLESPPAAAPLAAAPEAWCDTDTEGADTELQAHVTEAEKEEEEEEEEDFVRAGWLQLDFSEETVEEEGGFFREGGSEPDLGEKKVEEEEGGFFREGGSEPDLGEKTVEEEEGGFFRAGGLEPDLGEKTVEEEEGVFFRAVGLVQRPRMMEVEEDSSEMRSDEEEDDDEAKDTTYDGEVILKERRKRRRHWDRVERWWYHAGDGDDSDTDTDQSAPPTPPASAPPTPPAPAPPTPPATAAAPPAPKGEGKKSRKPVCPVCGEVRHKMKIHLVSKHNYLENTAKRWWVQKPCADPENRRRPCPIYNETLHLPSHLRKFHKLHPQSEEYKKALGLGLGLNKTEETSKQGAVPCPLLEAYHAFKRGTSRKEATLEQYRNYAGTLISKLAPNGTAAMLTVTEENPTPSLKVMNDLRAFFAANNLTSSTMCNYVRALVDFLKFTQANPPQHWTPAKEQALRSDIFNMKQEKDGFEKDKKRSARKAKATLRQRLPTIKINTNKMRAELDSILGKPPSEFQRGKDGVRARNLCIGLLAASNMSRGMELRSLTMVDLRSALTMPDYPGIIQFFTDHHKNEDLGPKELFLPKNDFERIRKMPQQAGRTVTPATQTIPVSPGPHMDVEPISDLGEILRTPH